MRKFITHLHDGVVATVMAITSITPLIPAPATAWGWHDGWRRSWGWHAGYRWHPGLGWAPPGPVVRAAAAVVVGPV
ncbi:hypothetical protein [Lichenicoccus roseus]|uniref:Uncharacterized protein n=1 Tax=Lichenicoccus roseus TaxID=2683649 RepID=A0A5R9J5G3_9PROT|nr:hypothetical protein [Lichenicoccus roseus]TLU72199.1 hypothetical protein FE263_13895 [Lichenicoccus roseus]